jgi:putative ubiquitin-RnfH superfamily antitoxin RatB of RatAB toxin-antitoxin module
MGHNIKVEVAYATPAEQVIIPVELEAGATVQMAIERSGVLGRFPEIDLTTQKVGVFSKVVALTDGVKDGDRVEIYRGLMLDPKESRRMRAVAAGQVLRRKHSRVKKKKEKE